MDNNYLSNWKSYREEIRRKHQGQTLTSPKRPSVDWNNRPTSPTKMNIRPSYSTIDLFKDFPSGNSAATSERSMPEAPV